MTKSSTAVLLWDISWNKAVPLVLQLAGFGVFPFAPLGGRADQKQLRAHLSVSVSVVTGLVYFSPIIKMKLKADLEDLHHLNKLKQGWYVVAKSIEDPLAVSMVHVTMNKPPLKSRLSGWAVKQHQLRTKKLLAWLAALYWDNLKIFLQSCFPRV